jgi:hypothetical protein
MALTITPALGPIFWLGDSWTDELSAPFATSLTLGGPSGFSDGHAWSYLVSRYLGQDCIPRWNPVGSPPNPLGRNYAVGSAGLNSIGVPIDANGLVGQVTLLVADYPSGLPSGSIVVAMIGINDVDANVTAYGGLWQPGGTTWTVAPTGGLTLPASGTANILLTSSTGLIFNPSGFGNVISIPVQAGFSAPLTITAVPDSTHVTVAVGSYGSNIVANNAIIKQTADAVIALNASSYWDGSIINPIVAKLPANGLLVLVNPPNVGLLPGNSTTAAVSTTTWNWFTNTMASHLPTTSPQVAGWDLNTVIADLVTNYPPSSQGFPSKFGYKTVTAGSGGTAQIPIPPGINPSDFVFWGPTATSLHPTGATHKIIAGRFINEVLKARGLISVY